MFKNIVLAAVLSSGIALTAQAAVESNYIVIDIDAAIYNSAAAKNVRDQIEQIRGKYQKEIEQKEEALKKEEAQLQKDQSTLSPEAFDKKVREFQTKVGELQRGVQIKRSKLEEAYEKALGQVNEKANKIIAEMAKEKSASLVLPTSQILYANENLNKTEEFSKKLNSQISSVKVDVK